MRAMKSVQTAAGGASLMSFVPSDHGLQHNVYAGYSPYFSDYGYPLSYYQAYGGLQGAQQYAVFGGGATAAGVTMAANPTSGFYPYFQYNPGSAATVGYSVARYPQLYQYTTPAMGATTTAATLTAVAGGLQQCGGAVALTPNSIGQAGMTMSLTAPTLPAPTAQYQYSRLIPSHVAAAPDQKPSLA
uniref:Uncharacterized protein n=1 Tax=Arundo donax TaxID=35708 RepID=A0A0A9E214_ARUDO